MFSSAFFLFGLAVIFQYVLAQSVPTSPKSFETEAAKVNKIQSQSILKKSSRIYFCGGGLVNSDASDPVQSDNATQIKIRSKRMSAKMNEIPYQIILQNISTGKYFCGGALINSFDVLTAAQCVHRQNISEIIVHVGAIRLGEDYSRTKRTVKEIIVHEKYDPRDPWRNDIALLRLAIVQEKRTRTVALPREQATRGDIVELARVSGYGITSESQEPSFQQLMQQYTYISPRVDCQSVYSTIQYNISKTQICAYDPYNPFISEKRISDTGGPLIINGELSGIASSTSTSSFLKNVTYPMIFTSVSPYRDWIWKKKT